jgi:hypothetical protein
MRAQAHRLVLAAFALAATMVMMVAAPAPGRAGVDADVRAGVFTNADAVGVGAGILTPVGRSNYRWYANPNAEVALGGDDLVALNGDFHYDVSHQRTTSVWLGAGPAIIILNHNGNSDTNLGVNLLAGMGKTQGSVRPYGQIKGVVADNSGVALVGGVRF